MRRLARVGYPLSQLVLVAYALWSVGRFGLGADGLLVISCAGVACALIDPWLLRMLEHSEQLEAQRACVALLQERAEKGREALEELRASGDALARLRECLAAGLDDVGRALDAGNADAARSGLRRMSEVVTPVDERFCENASVDALVASKVTEARARGVRLDVLASVPGSCDIPDVEALRGLCQRAGQRARGERGAERREPPLGDAARERACGASGGARDQPL